MSFEIDIDEILLFNKDLDRDMVKVLIRDGMALASKVAPCIMDDDFAFQNAAAAIIRGAILRWAESGSGALSSEQATAGPFSQTLSYDTRQARRSLFFPSEVMELQKLCKQNSGAFAVDTVPVVDVMRHAPECSTCFGAPEQRCTCGSVVNAGRGPLR
ncbi:hypothetical protein [Corynebacterium ulceribovis]|uniref:hypothetical protein n=1 Tax=Corynebacterium ulceribovis TaxID=487732 RepID=UPI00035F4A4D|nr:hypothetical protein [Corynebacterium ulceribovis]